MTLDLEFVSSSPMLSGEIISKDKIKTKLLTVNQILWLIFSCNNPVSFNVIKTYPTEFL